MKSATSKVVTALDVSVVVLATAAGVICGIVGLKSTRELNVRLHKVDETISAFKNLKQERLKAILMLCLPMLTISILLDLNVQWYIPFYSLYFILTGLQITFANTALGLGKRFQSLNLLLRTSFLPAVRIKEPRVQDKPKITAVKTAALNNTSSLASETYLMNGKAKSLLLNILAETHESLGKCVNLVSSSYGMAVLFILVSCFLHLLATTYFLFVELFNKKDNGYVWLQVLWIIFHSLRLLMVVEPCHRVSSESTKTIHIICEIERAVHDSILAEEVKKFWQQLLVFDPRFSACGLCMVDRTLLASISSAIATYLVILIQFQKTNG